MKSEIQSLEEIKTIKKQTFQNFVEVTVVGAVVKQAE